MAATGQIYSADADPIAPTYLSIDNKYQRIDLSNTWLFKATTSAYSTASDLALFGEKVMSGELLSDATMSVLLDEEHPMGFTLAAVPLGESTTPVITYNGELAGTTSMLTMFPEYDGVIVMLANNNTSYNTLVEMTIQIAEQAFTQ